MARRSPLYKRTKFANPARELETRARSWLGANPSPQALSGPRRLEAAGMARQFLGRPVKPGNFRRGVQLDPSQVRDLRLPPRAPKPKITPGRAFQTRIPTPGRRTVPTGMARNPRVDLSAFAPKPKPKAAPKVARRAAATPTVRARRSVARATVRRAGYKPR